MAKQFNLASLLKPLQQRIGDLQSQRAVIDTELETLNRVVADLGGKASKPTKPSKATANAPKKATAKKKRLRSSPEQLKEKASAIVAYIKAAGKEGASASDIIKRYPVVGSVKAFLKKWAADAKVKVRGSRQSTRYIAD